MDNPEFAQEVDRLLSELDEYGMDGVVPFEVELPASPEGTNHAAYAQSVPANNSVETIEEPPSPPLPVKFQDTVMDVSDAPLSKCVYIGTHHASQYKDDKNLYEIVITNEVTEIKQSAFQGCTNLQLVILPDGLQTIYQSAFQGCTNLQFVVLPMSLQTIYESAFQKCTSLQVVNLPPNIQVIPTSAFQGCSSLQVMNLPAGLQTIQKSAFQECTTLRSVNLPNGLQTIYRSAFQGCTNLQFVELPPSIQSISQSTFQGCSFLEGIALPPTLHTIEPWAFLDCKRLQGVYLPPGLQSIHGLAFENCSSLLGIEIPGSVGLIGNRAFCNCARLQQVIFNPSATALRIKGYAFQSCGLLEVTIPSRLVQLGLAVFRDCSLIRTVTFPDFVLTPGNLLSIPAESFYNCPSLAFLQLGHCVKKIKKSAFSYCKSLTKVSLPNTITHMTSAAFLDCPVVFDLTNFRGDGSQAGLSVQCGAIEADADDLPELVNHTKIIHSSIFCKNASTEDEDVYLNKTMKWNPGPDEFMKECDRYEIWAEEADVDKIPSLLLATFDGSGRYISGWMRKGANLKALIHRQWEGADFLQQHVKTETNEHLHNEYISHWTIHIPPELEVPFTDFKNGQRVFSKTNGKGTVADSKMLNDGNVVDMLAADPTVRSSKVNVWFDAHPLLQSVNKSELVRSDVSDSIDPNEVNLSDLAQMMCSNEELDISETALTVIYAPGQEEVRAAAKAAGNATQLDDSGYAAELHLMMRDLCC
jgi:hypothetical protein